ncbi:MAG: MucR family transcriptional regulator [Alphaproteobacteria bacterium]|nr:MucR family transcriptional regulator [Alphaproteobacteria bacterium]
MTAKVVSAYVGNNTVQPSSIPDVISNVYNAFSGLNGVKNGAVDAAHNLRPAVPIKKSITPDYIVCLEDGKKLKMLKRHLRTTYSLTPDQYRSKWGLKPDYPMVAPNYSAQRSNFAKRIGLGKTDSRPSRILR